MRKYLFIISLIYCCFAQAQSIGEWMVYPTYGDMTDVEVVDDEVFFVGGHSLFSYHIKDQYIRDYSKKDGLSNALVSQIDYDETTNTLVIIYTNQDIDLMVHHQIFNIPDFKDKILTVNKTINGIYTENGFAYLSTAFGALVIDLKKQEIADTYNLGKNTIACFSYNGKICLGTKDEGLWACNLTANKYDPANWQKINEMSIYEVVKIEDHLFGRNANNQLVEIDKDWNYTSSLVNDHFIRLDGYKQDLYLINTTSIAVYNVEDKTKRPIYNLSGCQAAVSVNGNEIWTSSEKGLMQFVEKEHDFVVGSSELVPNSPCVENVHSMDFSHGKLYLSTGGPFLDRNSTSGTVSVLDEGVWHTIKQRDLKDGDQDLFYYLLNITASNVDPDIFYVSCFRGGVYEFKNYALNNHYLQDNSTLQSIYDYTHVWASSMKMDPSGTLWVLDSKVENQLCAKSVDGKWYRFKVPFLGAEEDLKPLMITRHTKTPQKWFLTYFQRSTLNVYDDNGTLDDFSDDRTAFFNSLVDQDNNVYSDIQFRSIVEDMKGDIWIGTGSGPLILSSPESIFESNGNRCTRVKIPRNDGTGLADYLLENVIITSMVVDPANRKWVGSLENGIYLLSEDGLETIHHFTTENSPLPSNEILSLAYNEDNGILYIGTMGGLITYQSDATKGQEDYSNVYAYPNPVRPDYNGVITVCGLMDNSLIKVTDINNNLIYQGYSLGGQFTWNGLNVKGDKVKSGVYLVYGSNDSGKKGVVTKILFVR